MEVNRWGYGREWGGGGGRGEGRARTGVGGPKDVERV